MKKHKVTLPLDSKLNKNQGKKVQTWVLVIMKAIVNSANPHPNNSLEDLLIKYQKDDPVALEAALNAQIDGVSSLGMACELCVKKIKPEYEAIISPILKKNILLVVQYGAKPDAASPHPFDSLFADTTQQNLPSNYEFKFADLVNELIAKGADLSKKHRNQMTIAHYAAALDRKRAILGHVLEARPDLLDAKDSMGEQPLTSAIRFKNTAAAIDIITTYHPNLNAVNNTQATALSATIFYVDPLAAENLLMNGASICLSTKMILRETGQPGEDKKITWLLKILAKSGYFLQYDDCSSLHSVIEKYLKMKPQNDEGFFIILEDQETKKDDKPLHAWAVWGEIRGDKKRVDEKVLQDHRATAEAGRFCASHGQQGLKSVRVVDTKTGELVWSIKTKRLGAHGDPRVVAVPEDFHSESLHDEIKIYKFGDMTFHK